MILAGLGIAPAIACLYLLVDRLAPPAPSPRPSPGSRPRLLGRVRRRQRALGGGLVQLAGGKGSFLVAAGGVAAAVGAGPPAPPPVLAPAGAECRRPTGWVEQDDELLLARPPQALRPAPGCRATWSRVWGFARDFRWQIAGYLLLLALSALAAVVPALLVRELLNTAIPQRSFTLVNLIGLAAVGVAVANATGLALGQRFLSSRIGEA